MSWPSGVALVTGSVGDSLGASGESADRIYVAVVPVFGEGVHRLVWSATGTVWDDRAVVESGTPGLFVQVPQVDQPGFVDGQGNEVLEWYYLVEVIARKGRRSSRWTYYWQPRAADGPTVDLDTLGDGILTDSTPTLVYSGASDAAAARAAAVEALASAVAAEGSVTAGAGYAAAAAGSAAAADVSAGEASGSVTDALAAAAEAESSANAADDSATLAAGYADTAAGSAGDTTMAARISNLTSLTRAALNSAFARLSGVQATTSANAALVAGAHNPVDATSGNRTVTLADASSAGLMVAVSKKDSSANTVTVSVAHLRDGGAGTITLVGQYEALTLISKADGSWWPVADHKTKAYFDGAFVATQNADITVTVGPGGDYSTINAALAVLARRAPIFKAGAPAWLTGGLNAEIHLLTGFVMAEQVFVHRQDLGWITITAADRPVPIQRSALTVTATSAAQPAFFGRDNAVLPVIACLFSMDTSGVAAFQSGIELSSNSRVVVRQGDDPSHRNGFLNCVYRGINVQDGSTASAPVGDFSGCAGVGVRVANGSMFSGAYVKATGCGVANASIAGAHANLDASDLSAGVIGVRAAGGATVSIGAAASVAGCQFGLYATEAAVISAPNINAASCTEVAIRALEGGRVDCHDGTVSGSRGGLSTQYGGHIDAHAATANSCTTTGVWADTGSIEFTNGSANSCATGIQASEGGRVDASLASAKNCTTYGVNALSGSTVDVGGGDLSGAGTNGIRCQGGSRVNAQGATTQKVLGTSAAADTIVVQGGVINATALVGGITQAKNIVSADGIIFQEGASGVTGEVTVFTAGGTWAKPDWCTSVRVLAIGGGGAGGSGAVTASGTPSSGGAGGAGGAYAERVLRAADLTATVTVTVPAVAAGGAAKATTGTGNVGADGALVGFGSYVKARGGGGGAGGVASAASTAGVFANGQVSSGAGAPGASGAVGGNSSGSGGAVGGGAGGGISTTPAAFAGGQGGPSTSGSNLTTSTVGAAGGGAGTDGPASAAPGVPGSGASGGGSSITGNGGVGGAALGYGAGGAGGGSALAGSSSGAGGNGGPGIVVVIAMP